ncbi:YoaH family protein [Salmonella enterica subsp. enterica serovar 1,4,[5],12:i:-]|nr:YoaH family protein [Salmonella enterica subsp. enterica serovar 1,4,[5],12:i:-]
MFAGLPSLSHEQQQKAVERIQELMSQGTDESPNDFGKNH